jgi:hypothetical protein
MNKINEEHTSAIAVLTEIFTKNIDSEIKYQDSEIQESLATWLAIFRSRLTLIMAINAVRTSLNDKSVSELCDRYLACLEVTT